MEIRKAEDRRVGGRSEKLLTLEEAARHLGIPPDDVEGLIRTGRLPSFRLGGSLLRLRLSDVEALRKQEEEPFALSRPSSFDKLRTNGRVEGRSQHPVTPWDRIRDFFYFNDFYLIAFLIVLVLVAIIVSL